jgi:hypothetical protein
MLQKWCIRSHGEFKRGRKIAREIREFSRQPLTEAGLEIPSAQLPAAVFGTGSPPGAKFVRRRFPELLRLPAPATSDHGCRSAGKGERYALPPEILRNKFFTRIRFPTPMFEAIHSYERRPRFLRRFSRLATCFFFYNLLSLSADVEVHAAASAPRHASRRSIRSNETPKAAQILGLGLQRTDSVRVNVRPCGRQRRRSRHGRTNPGKQPRTGAWSTRRGVDRRQFARKSRAAIGG